MLIVDRVEGERAVIEIDGAVISIPARLLPAGASEGSVLRLEIDADATRLREAQARLERLKSRDTIADVIDL